MLELDWTFVDRVIKTRDENGNKEDFGRVLEICGSQGYTGAAYFAAQAAVRTGSGVVMLCVPQMAYSILAVKLSEPVVCPVPCNAQGQLTRQGVKQALEAGKKCKAILIGCGLGRSEDVTEAVSMVLQTAQVPVVLDADGINAIVGHIDRLHSTKAPVIITPHIGEFTRLTGIRQPGAEDAAKFAKETGAIVLLKGHRTCIAAPDGTILCNTTGNPGMAKGGSGDVLAGIIVSLCGQGVSPLEATAAGAFIHGTVGDRCANILGEYGMTPSDMLCHIPLVLRRYNSREW